jgi:hypothetical protein
MRIERKEFAPGRRDQACVACREGWEDEDDRERFFLESGDQVCFECVARGSEYIAAKFLERAEESRQLAERYEAAAKEGVWVPEHYQEEAIVRMAAIGMTESIKESVRAELTVFDDPDL